MYALLVIWLSQFLLTHLQGQKHRIMVHGREEVLRWKEHATSPRFNYRQRSSVWSKNKVIVASKNDTN